MPFISQKTLDQFKVHSETLFQELEKMKNNAYLVSLERSGRVNVFTFVRDGEIHTIETMGLISDDLPEWKEKLLR